METKQETVASGSVGGTRSSRKTAVAGIERRGKIE